MSAAIEQASLPDGAKGILYAAAGLFARKGYGPTTVRNIAAAAEVTVPMVYYYFDGKEQIFTTLFESIAGHMQARLTAAVDTPGATFRDDLIAVTHVFRNLLYPCPIALQLITQFVFGPRESSPCCDVADSHDRPMLHFQQLFETATSQGRFVPTQGYTPEYLAVYFVTTVRSHIMWVMKQMECATGERDAFYRDYLADEALERLVDVFLQGAGEATPEQH